ncbi:hypothetical protein TD95_004273 [Thielaviopsis punctulata]|uniref:AMP-dependent synthetase/ligase domain-containing protein n=1 Tax=Thielaviopsis punctulata TaxID=72032 RepID=A0A0F4ZDD5_9PEZI|nr:hypothetical protein TD95_004273 [Thielaviopsis punctulata]
MTSAELEPLWRPTEANDSTMWKFLAQMNDTHSLKLCSYSDLYKWSVENVEDFWAAVWHFVGVVHSVSYTSVLPARNMFPRPDFFSGSRLNFAQNLLYPANCKVNPDDPAVISLDETACLNLTPEVVAASSLSWAQLRDSVRKCSGSMRTLGVRTNDVVAGYVGNHHQALVAMLSAAAIGATWTSISPDTGVSAVVDRLSQVAPRILFADNGTIYNGKAWPCIDKTKDIVTAIKGKGLQLVVMINILPDLTVSKTAFGPKVLAVDYKDMLQLGNDAPEEFSQMPPNHPLYVLFSSGTTGLPKAIVHSATGTLLQHKKEHILHGGLDTSSRMMYYTTTSWMMWHWSVSALATGASLVLYTGSPFKPHGHLSMPRLISALRVTDFGTSAAYLTALESAKVCPKEDATLDLSCLRTIYSTASPLPPSTFRFVYTAFPPVMLSSITGGTDIISLFGAPCPILPVYSGQIQCAGLGMDIRAVDSETGEEVPPGSPGDLVCVKPFPSQPLWFYTKNSPALGIEKYRATYFAHWDPPETVVAGVGGPVWYHGDFVSIASTRSSRSMVMLGRSDGVLKPQGVRFGSAEIYNVLVRVFAAEVADALCVGRRRDGEYDETVCLFVHMVDGKEFTADLARRIAECVRVELSARHVPRVIEEAGGGIPRTMNGKKIEVAVKHILSGREVVTNASVANPEALEWFRKWAKEN